MVLILIIFMFAIPTQLKTISQDTILIFWGLVSVAITIAWTKWLDRIQNKQLSDKE